MRAPRLRNTVVLLARTLRSSPLLFLLSLLESVGTICIPLRYYYLGRVLGRGVAGQHGEAAHWIVVLIVNEVIALLAGQIGSAARIRLGESVSLWIDTEVATAFAQIPTTEFLQDPAFQDRAAILERGAGEFGRGVSSLFQGLAVFAGLASLVFVIVETTPQMLVLAALSFLPLARSAWTNRLQIECDEQATSLLRRAQAVRGAAISDTGRCELATAGSTRWCAAKMTSLIDAWSQQRRAKDWLVTLFVMVETALTLAAILLVMHGLSTGVRDGRADATQVIQSLLLVQQVMGVGRTTQMLQRVWKSSFTTLRRLAWLHDYAADRRAEAPASAGDAVRLTNVSFFYPGSADPALEGVSIELKRGTTTVVMGENGSGKSTLTRVMLGLLTPTSGTVSSPALGEGRSVVQQDFNRLEFTVRDSVAVGRATDAAGQARLVHSLREASAHGIVNQLPRGTEQQLGPAWTDGVGLSNGQWQRVAIARALFPSDTEVLVLDEPSSALDAHAERELLTAIGRSPDTIRVVVTHRISSVSDADQIVVMSDGRVVEQGDHTTLLQRGGLYAQMFAAQASDYADASPERTP